MSCGGDGGDTRDFPGLLLFFERVFFFHRYFLLHVMSEHSLDTYQVISVLGYSLLPICVLAVISIVIDLHGYFGAFLGVITVVWSARSATTIFESSLGMQQQRYLIAYPIALFYGAFVIFTIFR